MTTKLVAGVLEGALVTSAIDEEELAMLESIVERPLTPAEQLRAVPVLERIHARRTERDAREALRARLEANEAHAKAVRIAFVRELPAEERRLMRTWEWAAPYMAALDEVEREERGS